MARKKKKEKRTYDWEAIERQYRLGNMSLRMLSEKFGPAPGTISKRAKKYNWVQDKTQEVQELTKAALIKETPEGNTEGNTPTRADIQAAVETNVHVVRTHRKHIGKAWKIVERLENQLVDFIDNREEIEDDIDSETKEDRDIRRRNRMMKAVSFPQHITAARELSMTLKNLVPIERQAYNLDNKKDEDAGVPGVIIHDPRVTED